MGLIDRLIVVLTKFVSWVSLTLGLGAGETWPGEIALRLRPNIARSLAGGLSDGVILVAGTNGKTTTSLMIKTILEHVGDSVVHNSTGANLINGVVSSCIRKADWLGRVQADVGVFEIDENSLPIILQYITPKRILLLNLFRDQLDRYGEVDVIVEKWKQCLITIDSGNQAIKPYQLILNSDDPGVAALGKAAKGKVTYFGLNDPSKYLKSKEHAADSSFCSDCGGRLKYDGVYYSHIGVWRCTKCSARRPKPNMSTWLSPLPGLYNQYNTLAAVTLAKSLRIPDSEIKKALTSFAPAFGRQEEIVVNKKTIKLFLSKNPAGFNVSLRTVLDMGAKELLLVLNDRIPDGRDVSWIWDVDFEMIPAHTNVIVSGDRVYDMALRMKYAGLNAYVEPSLRNALDGSQDTMFILATYSAMLEVRKILKGRKIL